jgi:hypothetical protein
MLKVQSEGLKGSLGKEQVEASENEAVNAEEDENLESRGKEGEEQLETIAAPLRVAVLLVFLTRDCGPREIWIRLVEEE